MAITLLESAKLSQDTLKRGVVETFVLNAPVLQMLPFMDISGNAYKYNEEATLPGVAFRAVNGSYTESTGTVNPKTETLVILGGDADTDRYVAQTRSNINDQRAVQTALKIKAVAYEFQNSFFNGDTAVDANSFDGLKKRLTGNQVLTAATNGLDIDLDTASMNKFVDLLDELIHAVSGKADALFLDSKTLLKVKSIARQLGFADKSVDAFGRSIATYDGVKLFEAGEKVDGVKIIPHTETTGTSTNTTSIYAVKFGADEFVSGLTNGGVQVYDLGEIEAKPAYRTRIEFYCGVGVFNGKSAARLSGLIV
jgi:hypothetical protein